MAPTAHALYDIPLQGNARTFGAYMLLDPERVSITCGDATLYHEAPNVMMKLPSELLIAAATPSPLWRSLVAYRGRLMAAPISLEG